MHKILIIDKGRFGKGKVLSKLDQNNVKIVYVDDAKEYDQVEWSLDDERFNHIMHDQDIDPNSQQFFLYTETDVIRKYLLILVNIDIDTKNIGNGHRDIETVKTKIKKFIDKIDLPSEKIIVDNQKDACQIFILLTEDTKHCNCIRKDAYSLANRLKIKTNNLLNIPITLGISDVNDNITSQLYRQAKLALNLKLVHGINKVYGYNKSTLDHDMEYPENKLRLLEKCIKEHDYENIYALLREILLENCGRRVSGIYMRFIYFQVIGILFKLFGNQFGQLGQHLGADMIDGKILNSLESYDQLVEELFKKIKKLLESQEECNAQYKHSVNNVKKYIEQNYYNNLTVAQIAKHFSISENYLSHLFKKQTQKTITQYLTEVRIDNAIQLLKNTKVSAAKIGQSVGYNDPQYFYRVFKKITGKTTEEFRSYS